MFLPSHDPQFERLARNVRGMAASSLSCGPHLTHFFSVDEKAERLRWDDAYSKGDYVFEVGEGRTEPVCDVLSDRARLQDGVVAIWEECFVPPSDGTWQVRFVRFEAAELVELGRLLIPNRLCPGKNKIEVPPELRAIEGFWTYGEPDPSQCRSSAERRRITASRGLPSLIRVDPRAAEIEVAPLSFLFDFPYEPSIDFLFRDEATGRFYMKVHLRKDFSPVPWSPASIPPLVLSADGTRIEAVLGR